MSLLSLDHQSMSFDKLALLSVIVKIPFAAQNNWYWCEKYHRKFTELYWCSAFVSVSRWPWRWSSHGQIKHNLNAVQWRQLPTLHSDPSAKNSFISQKAFKILELSSPRQSRPCYREFTYPQKGVFIIKQSCRWASNMTTISCGEAVPSPAALCANGNHFFLEWVHVLWA